MGHFWAILGPLEALEKGLGEVLGLSWNHQKKSKECCSELTPRKKTRLVSLLGRAWGALERSWTRLGPLWGPSWGSLLGHLGAILSLKSPFKAKKPESPKH